MIFEPESAYEYVPPPVERDASPAVMAVMRAIDRWAPWQPEFVKFTRQTGGQIVFVED